MASLLLVLAWVGLSAAQTPPSAELATEEVVVWGEHHVRQARAAVIRAVEDLGWRARPMRQEGVVTFRPPEAWMGKARLTPEGELLFKRPVLAVEPMLVPGNNASYDPDAVLDRMDSSGIAAGPSMTLLPSEKRVLAVQERLRTAIQEPLNAYVQIYRVTGFRTLLAELPDNLDRLWESGTPLDGVGVPMESESERRLAVLSYWGSQPDNADGLAVSASVETWIRETVQRSAAPYTAAEIAAAEAMRGDGRTLADRIQLK